MRHKSAPLIFVASLALAAAPQRSAADDFFSGKTVKLVVGMPPGGGVDAYARLLQRHIQRHLPGNPAIVAQNMPGAGSLRSVQSLAAAPDDATTIVTFSSTLLTDSVLNSDKIKVDFRDFKFVGNVSEDTRVCYVRTGFGASTLAEMVKDKVVIFGATTASQPEASMIKNVLGVNMKIVMGYAGSADKRLALEKGEVDGDCGGWTSLPASWRTRGGPVNVFVRVSPTLLPGMDSSIPFAGDTIKDPDMRRIFDFLTAPTRLGRPFLVKGKVPASQLALLRAAFDKAMIDPELQAEAGKMELTVTPTSGAEVDRQIAALYATPPALIARAKQLTTN
jgi:tripartite-type tricarboxylate transporter receptor subunit TctC